MRLRFRAPDLIHEAHSARAFLVLLCAKSVRDNVFGRAAELAFFFLLSVFPLLIVTMTLIDLLAAGSRLESDMLRYFGAVMPPAAHNLLVTTLQEVRQGQAGAQVSLGLLVTLLSSTSGMVAIIEGLNTAYDVREVRSWWKRRVVALVLTLGMSLFGIVSLSILLYGNQLGGLIAAKAGLGAAFRTLWPLFQWPLMAGLSLLAFALVYRYAPNVRQRNWRWIAQGAAGAFLLWLLVSSGLRIYLHYFDVYRHSYGSLEALIVLMIWLYLVGIVILLGGEIGCILEQEAAKHGDPEAKLSGERVPGLSRG